MQPMRIGHIERIKDVLLNKPVERFTRGDLDNPCNHIKADKRAVSPARARLEIEWTFGDCVDVGLECMIICRKFRLIPNLSAPIRGRISESVRSQPRSVREQVMYGDWSINRNGPVFWNMPHVAIGKLSNDIVRHSL